MVALSQLRRTGIAAGGLISIRLGSVLAQFGMNVYLARLLPADQIAAYWLCTTTISVLSYIAGFGYQAGAIRFLPGYFKQRDFARARRFVIELLVMTCCGPVLFTALAWLGHPLVQWAGASLDKGLILPSASLLLPTCLLAGLSEIIRACHRPVKSMVVPSLIVPASTLLLVLSFSHYQNLTAALLLYLGGAVTGTGCILQFLLFSRQQEARATRGVAASAGQAEWFRKSLALGIFGLAWNLSQTIDFLLGGALLPSDSVAAYGAAVKLLAAQHLVSSTLTIAAGSHIAEKIVNRDPDLRAEAASLSLLLAGGMLGCFLTFLIFGRQFLDLFGPDFRSAYGVLIVLSLGLWLRSLLGPCEALLSYADRTADIITGTLLICFLSMGGIWAFTPRFGAIGIALASTASFLCVWLALYGRVRVLLGFDPSALSAFFYLKKNAKRS